MQKYHADKYAILSCIIISLFLCALSINNHALLCIHINNNSLLYIHINAHNNYHKKYTKTQNI